MHGVHHTVKIIFLKFGPHDSMLHRNKLLVTESAMDKEEEFVLV